MTAVGGLDAYITQLQIVASTADDQNVDAAVDQLREQGGEILSILRGTPFFPKPHRHSKSLHGVIINYLMLILQPDIPFRQPVECVSLNRHS